MLAPYLYVIGLMVILPLCVTVIYLIGKLVYYIYLGRKLAAQTKPFLKPTGQKTILVVGDSTAVGVGASDPRFSLAGLVAQRYPQARVINVAQSETRSVSLLKQFSQSAPHDHCDLVLCATGGLDVIQLIPQWFIMKNIKRFLAVAAPRASTIIIVTPLNLKFFPTIPRLIRSFYEQRSQRIGENLAIVAREYPNVRLLNHLLQTSDTHTPNWQHIVASDNIHPNDHGYQWTFAELERNDLLPEEL